MAVIGYTRKRERKQMGRAYASHPLLDRLHPHEKYISSGNIASSYLVQACMEECSHVNRHGVERRDGLSFFTI